MSYNEKDFAEFVNQKKNKYDLKGEIVIKDLFVILTSRYSFSIESTEANIELLKLQLLLMEFFEKNSGIKFSNTIGIKKSIEIKNKDFIEKLICFVNDYSKNVIYKHNYDLLKIAPPHKNNYRKEELLNLIEFQEDLIKNYLTDRKDFQKRFNFLVSTLMNSNVFSNSVKTIKTNEACFLYDIMSYFDIVPSPETLNPQEKYQFIKRYLKSN